MLTMANLIVPRGWVLALKLIVLKTRNLESKHVIKVGSVKTGSCLAQSKESSKVNDKLIQYAEYSIVNRNKYFSTTETCFLLR